MTINQAISMDELERQRAEIQGYGSTAHAEEIAAIDRELDDNDLGDECDGERTLSELGLSYQAIEVDRRLQQFRSSEANADRSDLIDREAEYHRFRDVVRSGGGTYCENAFATADLRLCVNLALESERLAKHRDLLYEVLGQMRRGERISINAIATRRGVPVTTLQSQWARAMLLMRQELQKWGPIQEWCDEHQVVA